MLVVVSECCPWLFIICVRSVSRRSERLISQQSEASCASPGGFPSSDRHDKQRKRRPLLIAQHYSSDTTRTLLVLVTIRCLTAQSTRSSSHRRSRICLFGQGATSRALLQYVTRLSPYKRRRFLFISAATTQGDCIRLATAQSCITRHFTQYHCDGRNRVQEARVPSNTARAQ